MAAAATRLRFTTQLSDTVLPRNHCGPFFQHVKYLTFYWAAKTMLSAILLAVEGGNSPTTVISLALRISVCTVRRPCLTNCSEGGLVVALTFTEKLNSPSE